MKNQRLVICLSLFAFLLFFPLQNGHTEDPILIDTNSCRSDADCKTNIPCNVDRCAFLEGQATGLCIHSPGECGPPHPDCNDNDPCTEDFPSDGGLCLHRILDTPECKPPPPPPPNCDDQDMCTLDLLTENGCEHRAIPNCPAPIDPCSPDVPRTLAIVCEPPPLSPTPTPSTPPVTDTTPQTQTTPIAAPSTNAVSEDYLEGSGGCGLQISSKIPLWSGTIILSILVNSLLFNRKRDGREK